MRLDRILLALTLAGIVIIALHRIVAYDIWWQIGAGRWIAEHGFPATDPFSYSGTGRPWIEMRWLWCLAVAGLHHLGGPAALILASAAIVLAAAVALARVAPAAPRWIGALAIAIAGALALYRLDLRPEIVSFLGLQLVLLWLVRLQAGERVVPWWSLAFLQLVWTNSHTLFVLGPATLAIFWCAEEVAARLSGPARSAPSLWRGEVLPPERRRLILRAALLCAAVCLVNPYGWRGATIAWTLWHELSSESAAGQWSGELRGALENFGWSFASLRIPVALALSAWALWANRRRAALGWIALWLAYVVLALRAERNLALFGWVAGTTTAVALAGVWRDRQEGRSPASPRLLPRLVGVTLALVAIGLLVSNAYYRRIDPDRRFGLGVAPGRFPDRPLAFLDQAGLDGRLLANLSDGGYVVFARGEQSVYIDGRLEVYAGEFLDQGPELYTKGADFDAVARKFDLQVVLVQFGKDGGLMRTLLRRADFTPVYFDADRVAFARAGGDAERWRVDLRTLGSTLRTELPGDPEGASTGDPAALPPERLLGLGRLAVLVGDLERARTFYRLALARGVRNRRLPLELAALDRIVGAERGGATEAILGYAAANGLEAALAGLESLAERGDFSEPRLFIQLATWANGARRLDTGERIARRWTEQEPQSPLAWKVLAAVALARQRPDEALGSLRRSLELDPRQLDAWLALTEAEHTLGNESAARDALTRALALAPDDPTALRLQSERANPLAQ